MCLSTEYMLQNGLGDKQAASPPQVLCLMRIDLVFVSAAESLCSQ